MWYSCFYNERSMAAAMPVSAVARKSAQERDFVRRDAKWPLPQMGMELAGNLVRFVSGAPHPAQVTSVQQINLA